MAGHEPDLTRPEPPSPRLPALDLVRAASICAVLAAHLLPLWAGSVKLNESVGVFGMSLFFVLSGYLITTQLLHRPTPRVFLARRMLRVLPAAWLCIGLVACFTDMSGWQLLRYLTFTANLPPQSLQGPLDHLWSLCVEVQFYLFAFVLLWARVERLRWIFPILLLAVTAFHVVLQRPITSFTWDRADDLLAGAVLAVMFHERAGRRRLAMLAKPWLAGALLLLLAFSSLTPESGHASLLSHVRPYLAAAFVASLMLVGELPWFGFLYGRVVSYVAGISYALYVWHLPLAATWLGSGDLFEKYAKRPLLFVVLVLVAHLSTFHFERHFTEWARRVGPRTPTKAPDTP